MSNVILQPNKIILTKYHFESKSKFGGSSKFLYDKDLGLIQKEKTTKKKHNTHYSASVLKRTPAHSVDCYVLLKKIKIEQFWSDLLPVFDFPTLKISDLTDNKKVEKSYKLNKVKIRKKIHSLLNTSEAKKRLMFVTITFPSMTTDENAFRFYNTWLTKLRKINYLHTYIWVSERQKNGTLHFHLLTTDYVKVKDWNTFMKDTLINEYNKDNQVFNGYDPTNYNGIDLAKNRKTKKVVNFAEKRNAKSLSIYVTKYITKNDTVFSRLVWHCSRNVSALFTSVYQYFSSADLKKYTVDNIVKFINTDFSTVYILIKELPISFFKDYNETNELIFNSI